ncbi:MAG: hypothetical protein JW819_07760 [Candidatus Krumholzibacteriota bacterium]|nr:hypothetical protein [Candidatus Krumholzibacteriota bacterium]
MTHVKTHILPLILLPLLLLPAGARAYVRLDFEQPYFVEEIGVQCKDHAVVEHEGLYHVFYIHSFPPEPGEYLRSEKWFGHLTTSDFKHWTRHDSILSVDVPNPAAWEARAVWAPKVIPDPGGDGWQLFYTGVNEDVAQQMGGAEGADLFTWTRMPANPLYRPGSWALWSPDTWSNCRDPELYYDEAGELWYLLNTTTTADSLGAIGYATSINLTRWTDQGPFFVNDTDRMLESCQLVKREGNYHLFFTEEELTGISHLISPTLLGGWDKETLSYVDYAHAAEVTTLDGEPRDLFSRHSAMNSVDGNRYYLVFDRIRFDTPDNVPVVEPMGGLSDNWAVVFGDAFEKQPTWGDNPKERDDGSSNMEGNSYLATFEEFPHPNYFYPGRVQGNVPTGLLRSVTFTVTGDRMRLLVGGGDKPGLCFVGLARAGDGRILFWETGADSYAMREVLWDLSTLAGQGVYVVVADLSTTSWGHISADSIEEYLKSGEDPLPPVSPLADGPLLVDVLIAAGYGTTDTGPAPAPAGGRLLAPHPNPFNPRTRLRYELDRSGRALLEVHDASGRLVRRLLDEPLPAGPGFCIWDGRHASGRPAPAGVYLARLRLDGRPLGSRRLVLVK